MRLPMTTDRIWSDAVRDQSVRGEIDRYAAACLRERSTGWIDALRGGLERAVALDGCLFMSTESVQNRAPRHGPAELACFDLI